MPLMGSGVTGLYRMLRTYGDTILRATRELFRCHPFVVPFIRDGSSSVVSPPPSLSLALFLFRVHATKPPTTRFHQHPYARPRA